MTLRRDAIDAHPDFPWLELDAPGGIEAYLRERGWLESGERVEGCERAGEGNMNLTVRIRTDRRRFVLKQARPWVEKYDHIPAPWDRSLFEQRFYARVASIPEVAERMPEVLGSDPDGRALLLEDLREARDLTALYGGDKLREDECAQLADYLRHLHGATEGRFEPELANRDMRRLNHEHLFVVPLAREGGLDLDAFEPGLARAARALRDDAVFRRAVEDTGRRYLADGPCLVHGDYFPGSWLRTPAGVRVIDPEFCFYGDAEVDAGCALAHLVLAAQPLEAARDLLARYTQEGRDADAERLARHAGVEVMRRLIGVAQLPLPLERGGSRTWRAALLERARRAVHAGRFEALWP